LNLVESGSSSFFFFFFLLLFSSSCRPRLRFAPSQEMFFKLNRNPRGEVLVTKLNTVWHAFQMGANPGVPTMGNLARIRGCKWGTK
jgi:hypothetical protein